MLLYAWERFSLVNENTVGKSLFIINLYSTVSQPLAELFTAIDELLASADQLNSTYSLLSFVVDGITYTSSDVSLTDSVQCESTFGTTDVLCGKFISFSLDPPTRCVLHQLIYAYDFSIYWYWILLNKMLKEARWSANKPSDLL